jgi:hypothetical protein
MISHHSHKKQLIRYDVDREFVSCCAALQNNIEKNGKINGFQQTECLTVWMLTIYIYIFYYNNDYLPIKNLLWEVEIKKKN